MTREGNWTPVYDELLEAGDDVYLALVYGKIKRICDWSPMNICTFSNKRLAEQLKCSEKTIRNKKEKLQEIGWIKVVGRTGQTDSVALTRAHVVYDKTVELDAEPPWNEVPHTPEPSTNEDTNKERKERLVSAISKHSNYRPEFPPPSDQVLNTFWDLFRQFNKTLPPNFQLTKTQMGDWVKTGNDWSQMGMTPYHVKRGFSKARESGTTISRPGSITNYMISVSAKE